MIQRSEKTTITINVYSNTAAGTVNTKNVMRINVAAVGKLTS